MKNSLFFLKNHAGLLSLVVILLFFNSSVFSAAPPGSSTTNITICNNQLPYLWNGITCLNAGTYTATLTGSNGTDSIATLNLSVINVSVSITNVIICDNQLPYQWNGNNYNANGTYSVTLTSSSGCDSVPILSLTVNHVVTSSTNHTVCSNQLPYNWNGNNYNATGSYNAVLTSVAGCDSIATLHLTVNQVSSSTTNVAVCTNQLPYNWNGNSYNAAGSYSITLQNSVGCDSVATLVLTTKPTVTSNSFITICSNQLPYNWNNNNYPAAGTYAVTLTGSNSCDSVATLHLSVTPVRTSITNTTICTGQLPYTWNGNSYPTSGTYNVNLTGSNGCDSIATLQLTTVPFYSSSTSYTVCSTELPYNWNGIDYNSAGTYTANFITAAGCDSIATLQLIVATPVVATDSISICPSALPYNFYGNIFTTAGTYEINPPVVINSCYTVDTVVLSAILIIPSTISVSVCSNHLPYVWNGNNYSSSGTYGVLLTSSAGCDSLANLTLTVNQVSTSTTDITICSNQVPFQWNGFNYNSSGIYPVTLVAANGCDSIATLNLTVNPITTSTTSITVCNSQVPYNWNGNNYSVNGTYTVTLINSSGCDSVATLQFIVLPFLSSTTNVTICSNQLPYNWNGTDYNAPGVYVINLTSSSGCDSVATLNLVINDVITSTTNVNTCTNQLPYVWNGNNYNATGSYQVTLITSGGCDSVATLNLVVNDVVTSTTDLTVCNNQLPYQWNGNSYPIAGSFPVTLTSSAGCDSIAVLNLSVTDILTSTTNVNICPAQLPYHWNGNIYNSGGTYSVTLSNPQGCDSVPVLSLTIIPYVTSTTNVTICSTQLPYAWNGNSYNAAGAYNVLLNGSNFCDSLATLNLTVILPSTSTTPVTICENLLPYTWNGNNYNAAGNYQVHFTASNGCDSIATLNLIVIPVHTSTINVIVCDNQLPFIWNGNTYTSSGSYPVTLSGSNGCDSIATLQLVVNPVTNSNTTFTICENQLPYSWNGNNYNVAGNYSVTLTGSLGCDSIATLHLFTSPVLSSNSIAAVCDNQLPFVWNNNNYSATGNYQVTLTSTAGCDSIAHLALTVNPVTTSNSSASVCINQLPYNWNGNQYSTPGDHQVTLTGSLGCDSVAHLYLTILPLSNSNTPVTRCANQLPYVWNGQSYSTAGNYSIILTGANGCDSTAHLQLTVLPIDTTYTNISVCSASLPYVWNGNNYTTAGLHYVTLAGSDGCDSVATLNLTINPTPSAPTVVSPVVYCQYDNTVPLNATATSGNQITWYTTATGGTGTNTAPTPSSAVAGTTNYYVSQTEGPCEGPRELITVTVNSKPDLGPDQSLRICFGDSANLAALYNTSGLISYWSMNNQQVPDSSSVHESGSYQLFVQNSNGCMDTALVALAIQPEVIANAGNDADAEYNIPYQLIGSGGISYLWSPAGNLNNPFAANPLATLTESTTFILTVKDEIGCADVDTVKLRVLKGPTFYVPTAFSPNGDGLNDIFKPTPIGIAKLDYFKVFNRYGELVYQTSEIGKGWDGTYKGIRQPIGNYVWWVRGTDRTGQVKFLKGNVVLIR